jgi:hypothetical protein
MAAQPAVILRPSLTVEDGAPVWNKCGAFSLYLVGEIKMVLHSLAHFAGSSIFGLLAFWLAFGVIWCIASIMFTRV